MSEDEDHTGRPAYGCGQATLIEVPHVYNARPAGTMDVDDSIDNPVVGRADRLMGCRPGLISLSLLTDGWPTDSSFLARLTH